MIRRVIIIHWYDPRQDPDPAWLLHTMTSGQRTTLTGTPSCTESRHVRSGGGSGTPIRTCRALKTVDAQTEQLHRSCVSEQSTYEHTVE